MSKTIYGPYPDKSKDGRKKMTVVDDQTGKHTSTNAARYKKEKQLGRKLPKNVDVDHKDNNKHNDGAKNLRTMSHSKNVAKENKHRVRKKK
jgi:hypothetical protein